MELDVKLSRKKIDRLLKDIDKKVIPAALPAAINKTLKMGRTESVRRTSKEYKIKQKVIRGRTSIKLATRRRPTGSFYIGVLPIKASDLGKPRQLKRTARAGRHSFPGGFVATMPSGHVSVFKRKGKQHLPIKEQSVRLEGADRISREAFRYVMKRDFGRLFRHEVKRQLNRRRRF